MVSITEMVLSSSNARQPVTTGQGPASISPQRSLRRPGQPKLIIITSKELFVPAQRYATYKQKEQNPLPGVVSPAYAVTVITVEQICAEAQQDIDNLTPDARADLIRAYLQSQAPAENSEPPYLILFGDVKQVPTRAFAQNNNDGQYQYFSDLYFYCPLNNFDQDDDGLFGEPSDIQSINQADGLQFLFYPGRIPLHDRKQATNWVDQTINYSLVNDMDTKAIYPVIGVGDGSAPETGADNPLSVMPIPSFVDRPEGINVNEIIGWKPYASYQAYYERTVAEYFAEYSMSYSWQNRMDDALISLRRALLRFRGSIPLSYFPPILNRTTVEDYNLIRLINHYKPWALFIMGHSSTGNLNADDIVRMPEHPNDYHHIHQQLIGLVYNIGGCNTARLGNVESDPNQPAKYSIGSDLVTTGKAGVFIATAWVSYLGHHPDPNQNTLGGSGMELFHHFITAYQNSSNKPLTSGELFGWHLQSYADDTGNDDSLSPRKINQRYNIIGWMTMLGDPTSPFIIGPIGDYLAEKQIAFAPLSTATDQPASADDNVPDNEVSGGGGGGGGGCFIGALQPAD